MKLSRKLQKLFTAEAVRSLREHALRWAHPIDARPLLERLDPAAWARLRERFPHRADAPKINRFVDAEHWIPVSVERAQDLWLDRTPPSLILDLGCGPGYFLYVCKHLGHEGAGIDIDEQPLFRETTSLLGVSRIIWRIQAGVPLPELEKKFDLVTAHRVCFHKIARGSDGQWEMWDRADWQFFLRDIRTRFLNPEGRLLLDFNPRADGCTFFTADLRDTLVANGARIFRSKALFGVDPAQAPEFKVVSSAKTR